MRRSLAMVAAVLVANLAGEARAQYTQSYVQYVAPRYYTYTYAYPTYTRGYQAIVPQYPYRYQYQYTRPVNPTSTRNRPYYGAYGYGINSNGSTDGYPPFRGRGWR